MAADGGGRRQRGPGSKLAVVSPLTNLCSWPSGSASAAVDLSLVVGSDRQRRGYRRQSGAAQEDSRLVGLIGLVEMVNVDVALVRRR